MVVVVAALVVVVVPASAVVVVVEPLDAFVVVVVAEVPPADVVVVEPLPFAVVVVVVADEVFDVVPAGRAAVVVVFEVGGLYGGIVTFGSPMLGFPSPLLVLTQLGVPGVDLSPTVGSVASAGPPGAGPRVTASIWSRIIAP